MSETNFLLDALKEFEQKVVETAKKNLSSKGKDSTGKLSQSIQGEMQVMPNSIRVFFQMERYGWYQDLGVQGKKTVRTDTPYSYKSKMPPPSELEKWVKRKGLKGRNRKTGRFISHKSLSFLIARSIFNKGIKPSMFFTKPFENAYQQLPDELIEKYGLDMETLLVNIIDENFEQYYE